MRVSVFTQKNDEDMVVGSSLMSEDYEHFYFNIKGEHENQYGHPRRNLLPS